MFLALLQVPFSLGFRLAYFGWILAGAFWIWDQIETRPRIAAMCFGTLGEAELNQSPAQVFSKVASVFGKKIFVSNECPQGFVSYYKLRRLEFGSWDGEKTNYLKIRFRRSVEYYDPSVLYLHSLSRGGQAVKMLTRQGFVIEQPLSCMSPAAEYLRRGQLHICLYHKRNRLCGAVIYNGTQREVVEHYQGEWNYEEIF